MSKTEISARDKLREAMYFLCRMEDCQTGHHDSIFNYNLDAFLVVWASIPDILLYDFAERFGFKISRDDRMEKDGFELVAKSHGHKDALAFFVWWKKAFRKLANKHHILFGKRKVVTHRGPVKVGRRREVKERVYLIDMSVGVTGVPAWADEETQGTGVVPGTRLVPSKIRSIIYFAENPKEDILHICERAWDDMKNLVDEAEKGAWKREARREGLCRRQVT